MLVYEKQQQGAAFCSSLFPFFPLQQALVLFLHIRSSSKHISRAMAAPYGPLKNGLQDSTPLPSTEPLPNFNIPSHPVENHRPLKVIVIGAGYSGIYMGIRIPERLRNVSLTIYEKNAGVGGTWWENRYAGAACDIASHSYQYTFAPNPNWSHMYAQSAEIREYLTMVAEKYGATRFIKLRHNVLACDWDDTRKKWKVKIEDLEKGVTVEDESDIVITARGILNTIQWPKVQGLNDFEGELMHSATWNEK